MTTFNRNSYETPDKEANLIAKLVLPTDKSILEPFAGTGQIVKALLRSWKPKSIVAFEKSLQRADKLSEIIVAPPFNEFYNLITQCRDFFQYRDSSQLYDLIITNPPFDTAIKGIKYSLTLLNDKPESRLLFLLPLPFFSSQKRSKEFKALDCHIAAQYMIPWRIDYLKDGKPMSQCQKEINGVLQFKEDGTTPVMNSGSQEYHAVFCIKKGKNPDSNINFLA